MPDSQLFFIVVGIYATLLLGSVLYMFYGLIRIAATAQDVGLPARFFIRLAFNPIWSKWADSNFTAQSTEFRSFVARFERFLYVVMGVQVVATLVFAVSAMTVAIKY